MYHKSVFKKNQILFFIGLFIVLTFLIFLLVPGKLSIYFGAIVSLGINLLAAWIYEEIKKNERIKNDNSVEHPDFLEYESWLKKKRINEIIRQFDLYYPILIRERHKYTSSNISKQWKLLREDRHYKWKPAWYSISRTNSAKKYRLTLGFRNSGCAYWRDDTNKIGCLNCGYGSSALPGNLKITNEDLFKQFKFVRAWAFRYRYDFDVIEFLNDGSFLNYQKEWPEGFPVNLFKLLGTDKSIKRILIESRPEYITKEKIERLLRVLRSDQSIEIGIGLESSDEFIRNVCIRKGYTLEDFEKSITIVSAFERVSIVVYSIIKPNFITEFESIEDIVNTTKYLTSLEKRLSVKIVHKLEPVVVAQGTLIEILHFRPLNKNDQYKVLSYWSVVEIICRIYDFDNSKQIRIGAREDMDIIERVSGIYNDDETFNQYDFWCYNTIQKYNCDNDFIHFISNISFIIENDDSFNKWKNDNGITDSYVNRFLSRYSQEIIDHRKSTEQQEFESLLNQIFAVLDQLELTEVSQSYASNFRNEYPVLNDEGIKVLEEFINEQFKLLPNLQIVVNNYYHENSKRKILRVYFDLINFTDQEKYDIWIGIPTA